MNLKCRRGQAFDTMMLVISVIVAVAILGVLLSLIPTVPEFGNAKQVLPDLLTKVSNVGFGVEGREKVEFTKDDKIYVQNIITNTAIPPEKLHVCIDSSLKPSPLDFIKSASDARYHYLEVKSSLKAAIAVCKGGGLDVRIYISDTKNTAVANCDPAAAGASC